MPPYATQISKTGFVLENRIAKALKAAKWTVISNRYYVDDAEESVREIDLVAYQVSKIKHFNLYTVLIISCKKNESNAWALLSREIDLKNPNYDWTPLHTWTNDKAVQHQLSNTQCARRYHTEIISSGVTEALAPPRVEVFAFQEMSKSSGAPQNDKNIFQAVTSLMKAQAYEVGSLPQRRKSPAIYQFNLLSVVDTDLIRLDFTDTETREVSIESEHYIARYIIRKKETFSRIRFLNADALVSQLPDYGRLHQANCIWFPKEYDAFYTGVIKDPKRVDVFLDDFRKDVYWYLSFRTEDHSYMKLEPKSLWLHWSDKDQTLNIFGPFGESGATLLNADERANARVAESLKKYYRYKGPFKFEDTPF